MAEKNKTNKGPHSEVISKAFDIVMKLHKKNEEYDKELIEALKSFKSSKIDEIIKEHEKRRSIFNQGLEEAKRLREAGKDEEASELEMKFFLWVGENYRIGINFLDMIASFFLDYQKKGLVIEIKYDKNFSYWQKLIYLLYCELYNTKDEVLKGVIYELMKKEPILNYLWSVLGYLYYEEQDYVKSNKYFQRLNMSIDELEDSIERGGYGMIDSDDHMDRLKAMQVSIPLLWKLQVDLEEYESYFSKINKDKFELNILPKLEAKAKENSHLSNYCNKLIKNYYEKDAEEYATILRKVIEGIVVNDLFRYFIKIESHKEFYQDFKDEIEFKSCMREYEYILRNSVNKKEKRAVYNVHPKTKEELEKILHGLRYLKMEINPFGHYDFENQYKSIRLFGLTQIILDIHDQISKLLIKYKQV